MTELSEPSGYSTVATPADKISIKLKCRHMYHKTCLKAMYDSSGKVSKQQLLNTVIS